MFNFINKGGSIIRFGDGELNMMIRQSNLGFQTYSPELSQALQDTFLINKPNVLICIPRLIACRSSYDHLTSRAKYFWAGFINRNYQWLDRNLDGTQVSQDSLYNLKLL